jgi:ribosomal protein S18 acetylase RimI-like enzyme
MADQPRFLPASSFALDALADIFTRSFEAYFYQGVTTAELLARRVRAEQIDLHRSLVMLLGDAPAGQALVALRGERAWCGGFGVMLPFRGRGLARPLAAAMLDSARQAGARSFSLEVLTRNERAIKTYTHAGFRARRDLQIFEWRRPDEEPPRGYPTENREPGGHEHRTNGGEQRTANRAATNDALQTTDDGQSISEVAEPLRLLDRFAALHPSPAAWQRDLPALLARGGVRGLAIMEHAVMAAYVLFQLGVEGSARIEDLGAERAEQAAALLGALQSRSARIVSVNEPADSPLTAAFLSAGFLESDRQHELSIEL